MSHRDWIICLPHVRSQNTFQTMGNILNQSDDEIASMLFSLFRENFSKEQ